MNLARADVRFCVYIKFLHLFLLPRLADLNNNSELSNLTKLCQPVDAISGFRFPFDGNEERFNPLKDSIR
jgi:hypothetical protein